MSLVQLPRRFPKLLRKYWIDAKGSGNPPSISADMFHETVAIGELGFSEKLRQEWNEPIAAAHFLNLSNLALGTQLNPRLPGAFLLTSSS
jgi:hypothetical protein